MATQTTEKKSAPTAKTGAEVPATKITAPTNLATQTKTIVDSVEEKVLTLMKAGQLHMPKDYSVENALKSAYLVLQTVKDKDDKPALDVCTRESIANSLLDMVVQGLNPMKKQGYFIVYGKTLVFQRSYMGAMAVAQMVCPEIDDWGYAAVYQGDEFEYTIENGKKTVTKHTQKISNVVKTNIIAAYCMALDDKGMPIKTEIMTIDQIHQAWRQSRNNPMEDNGKVKASSTHGKFAEDMAIKTVCGKNAKLIINTSSDNALLLNLNKQSDIVDAAAVQADISEKANTGEVLQITDAPNAMTESVNKSTGEVIDKSIETAPICTCKEMLKDGHKQFEQTLFDEKPQGRGPGF